MAAEDDMRESGGGSLSSAEEALVSDGGDASVSVDVGFAGGEDLRARFEGGMFV